MPLSLVDRRLLGNSTIVGEMVAYAYYHESIVATVSSDLDPDATTYVARLRLVTTRLARRLRHQADLPQAMTPSRLSALTTISRRGPLRLGDLARKERIGKSSVTRLIATLEAGGYVHRRTDPQDGRSWLIGMTGDGERLLEFANGVADGYLERQLSALDKEDREAIDRALPALERLLEVRR